MQLRGGDELVELGTLTPAAAAFLEAAKVSGLNIIVAGGTQARKTTLLSCAGAIPAGSASLPVRKCSSWYLDVVAISATIASVGTPPSIDAVASEASTPQARAGAHRQESRRQDSGRRGSGRSGGTSRQIGVVEIVIAALAVMVLFGRPLLGSVLDHPAVQTWSTIFVSIVVQAVPFLVLGVLLSAAITAYVPPSFFARVLPRSPALSVPVAGAAGVVLPGCECASVPVAGSLVARGVTPAAAFAFLLSAPAINPVVLVSTAVAFPGQPRVVLARFLASLATAVLVGWVWARFGRGSWLRPLRRPDNDGRPRGHVFREAAQHDLLHAGGFLVVGGLTAATLNVVVPDSVLSAVASSPWLSVLVLGLLAVVLAICSEADAFVAATLTQFSMTARLAFMVVGPAVDVKLVSLQSGVFGGSFAARFAPLTFVVAIVSSVVVGWWLL